MAREWYCQLVGAECGPFEPAQLRAMARGGKIAPEDLVRRGTGPWVEARKVRGLFDVASVTPVTPVTQVPAATTEPASAPSARWPLRWVVACAGIGLVAMTMLVVAGVLIYGQWFRQKPAASAPPEQPAPAKAAPAKPAQPPAKTPPAKPEPPTLTMAGYLAVTPGMSYAEAVKHLGSQGQETSRMRLDVIPGLMDASEVVSYVWTSPNGARVEADFLNDKLIAKRATGLK
jgi:hypothetical protein